MRAGNRAMPARVPSSRAESTASPLAGLLSAGLLAAALSGCSAPPAHNQAPSPRAVPTVGCSYQVPPVQPIKVLSRQLAAVPAAPWAAVALPHSGQVVASLTASGPLGTRGELAVLASQHGGYQVARTVSLPPSVGAASGMAASPDGRLLLVAGQSATAVVSTARLAHGQPHPVLGVLTDSGAGQSEVAVSGDGRYAFVTDEASGGLSVFDLALALRRGFRFQGVAAGFVPLAKGPVGVAVAPSGGRVYVTTLGGGAGPHGQLWVVDARRAERGGGRSAVLAQVRAGCQPVRVAVSPDGTTVWVTALQSEALLGFGTAALEREPVRALRAVVRTGPEPVGLLLLDHGKAALVGDSNRYGLVSGSGGNGPQRISVVSTAAALSGRPAVVGSLPAGGLFPRDLGYDTTTGQLLVPDYGSQTVEFVRVSALP